MYQQGGPLCAEAAEGPRIVCRSLGKQAVSKTVGLMGSKETCYGNQNQAAWHPVGEMAQ